MVPSTLYIIQRRLQANYENGDMNKGLNSVYSICRDYYNMCIYNVYNMYIIYIYLYRSCVLSSNDRQFERNKSRF